MLSIVLGSDRPAYLSAFALSVRPATLALFGRDVVVTVPRRATARLAAGAALDAFTVAHVLCAVVLLLALPPALDFDSENDAKKQKK
jgi:hypothetical protein